MGVTRILCKIPTIVAVLVMLVLVGVSAWNVMAVWEPKVGAILHQLVGQYDSFMPEITISNGRASIKEKQPYYLNDDPKKGPIIVIDTRPDAQSDTMEQARHADKFIALTRDFLIIKDERQDKILPLAHIPDITLNADRIDKFVTDLYPTVVAVAGVLLAIWFLMAKLFQILILALLFYWLTQKSSAPPSYGRSFNIATFALIIPVILDLTYLSRSSVGTAVSWLLYTVACLVTLGLAYRDYTNAPPHKEMDRQAPINP